MRGDPARQSATQRPRASCFGGAGERRKERGTDMTQDQRGTFRKAGNRKKVGSSNEGVRI